MHRIHGQVVLKETNIGIPNLVVSAYDSESTSWARAEERTPQALTSQFLDSLGKRIGSVLTDPDGRFRLTREDLHFDGVESRPDLMLVVFAPEDIVDPLRPFALPPEQRVLYISSTPRSDAGAEEAYIIRLLQLQLDHFGILTGDAATRQSASSQLLTDVTRGIARRAALKATLQPQVTEQYKKNRADRDTAKQKVQGLTALPLTVRDHPLLLKHPADTERLQKEVVTTGLSNLANYAPEFHVAIRLADARSHGISVGRDGNVKGKIATDKLVDIMHARFGGIDLVRIHDVRPSEVTAAALHAKYAGITPPKRVASPKRRDRRK